MVDPVEQIGKLWADNRKIDARLTSVERHLTDHVCACSQRWDEVRGMMKEVRENQKWMLRSVVVASFGIIGSLIWVIFKITHSGFF